MPATTRSATKRRRRGEERNGGMRRQRSSDDLSESDAIANLNVNWVGNWFFFWYVIGILLFRWCCHLVAWTHGATAWTVTHFVHGFIMFLALHWVKGTPTGTFAIISLRSFINPPWRWPPCPPRTRWRTRLQRVNPC